MNQKQEVKKIMDLPGFRQAMFNNIVGQWCRHRCYIRFFYALHGAGARVGRVVP